MADKEKFTYNRLHDHEWLRHAFMISHDTQTDSRGDPLEEDIVIRTRFFTPAALKFADTSLGGNMVINPLPQFTRTMDPRVKGLYAPSEGMGRMYSDMIDDNKRYITMIFGFGQHNSLSSFYKGMYSGPMSAIANTGRGEPVLFQAGKAIGFIVGHLSPWLILYSVGSAFVNWATGVSSSKYYFFKPGMATYWNAVTGIANDIAVKTQLITRAVSPPVGSPGNGMELTDADIREIHKGMPDLIDSYNEATGEGNGINVYAVATKYQRMQRRAFKALEMRYNTQDAPWSMGETSMRSMAIDVTNTVQNALAGPNIKRPKRSFVQYLEDWSTKGPGTLGGAQLAQSQITVNEDGSLSGAVDDKSDLLTEKSITLAPDESALASWSEFLAAELDDGAQYVSFRVENTGDVSESFSSQVAESEILTKINSMSGASRETRFSIADGNIDDGIAGKFIGGALSAVKDLAGGVVEGLGFGGLKVLGGNAFADIPRHWVQASSQMPTMNYTVRLFSVYGNRYAKFMNIWLPLSMLLAGALPLSTGPHSYTSPFLCQLFDRGRAQTRLGIIDSMQITRGRSNLAFNKVGEPSAVEVNFTVAELSTVLHMPIQQGFNPTNITQIFDHESIYHDYISVLSSLSLAEQIYVGERLKLGLTRYLKNVDSYFSVPHAVNAFGDLAAVRVFSMFFDGIANR